MSRDDCFCDSLCRARARAPKYTASGVEKSRRPGTDRMRHSTSREWCEKRIENLWFSLTGCHRALGAS
jgi:hypothetical protein